MGTGGIGGRLWLRKKMKDWVGVKVLGVRQGSGSDTGTGDRGRSSFRRSRQKQGSEQDWALLGQSAAYSSTPQQSTA